MHVNTQLHMCAYTLCITNKEKDDFGGNKREGVLQELEGGKGRGK